MLKLKLQYFGHLWSDANSWHIGKDRDAGKYWKQEKRVSEDEMVGWHHWFKGHELGQTLGDGEGQGNLVCCSAWGRKESGTTWWLNNNTGSHGLPGWLCGQESSCSARDPALIPGLGRSPGVGYGDPLQYSCLENAMNRRAWRATVPRVTRSWRRLVMHDYTYTALISTTISASKFPVSGWRTRAQRDKKGWWGISILLLCVRKQLAYSSTENLRHLLEPPLLC